MSDHSHPSSSSSEFCEHCGQRLPPSYGTPRTNKGSLGAVVLVHLLLLGAFIYYDTIVKKTARPLSGALVYLSAPAKPKPKQQEQARPPIKMLERVMTPRLPNSITIPFDKPVEPIVIEKKTPVTETAVDMEAYINARRKARGQSSEPAPETDAERGVRIAKANIAAANARSNGGDANDTGGVFEVRDKSFASATVKFRGWNTNFKRRWLQEVKVELGKEVDIETAIVRKMIELIRKEKKGDFTWESQRLGRAVPMSARIEDTAELEAFLFKEMFPEYRPPRH
ncbi:MAG: hypothetical protein V4582_04645 [Pseudomonadota bacterium]